MERWTVYFNLGALLGQRYECLAEDAERAFENCEGQIKGAEVIDACPTALDTPILGEWCVKVKEAGDEFDQADMLECRKFVDEFEAIDYAQRQAQRGLDANLFHGEQFVREYE
jgi:hypothetical protein